MVAPLWALNMIKKFVLPEKVDQSLPKNFTGCYRLRPPIVPNFIEIGQTSLEIGGCQLGLGHKKLFCHGQKRDYLSRNSQCARGATKNSQTACTWPVPDSIKNSYHPFSVVPKILNSKKPTQAFLVKSV